MLKRSGSARDLLWFILSMFIIALLLNSLVDSQRMMLSFYMMPTLGSAYPYGRRHATLTALGSVLMVLLLTTTSGLFGRTTSASTPNASRTCARRACSTISAS